MANAQHRIYRRELPSNLGILKGWHASLSDEQTSDRISNRVIGRLLKISESR
jgi:hypothetical protein